MNEDTPYIPTYKSQTAKAFLLTCMDFRFIESTRTMMNELGYFNKYDHFILKEGQAFDFHHTAYCLKQLVIFTIDF